MGTMERILRLMADKQASDVYLSAFAPATIRIHGRCQPLNNQALTPEAPRSLLAELLPAERLAELDRTGELNLGFPRPGVGRFRLSAMRQRGSVAAVIRFIASEVPALASLAVPPILADLVMEKRGLLLMVGATGMGKSTTLASMVDHRNTHSAGHILTIEDPIEFLFRNNRSVGEIRDRETMSAAIAYAQSGHLCLATLHANNSYHALNRILSFYPVETRAAMLGDLASALKAIVSQRLLRTVAGGRTPAVEVMLNTQLVAELIEKGDFSGVKEALEKSMAEGSQNFEQDIARLIHAGVIERQEGLTNADSPTNLMWRLQNDFHKTSQATAPADDPDDQPSFTEITLDVKH